MAQRIALGEPFTWRFFVLKVLSIPALREPEEEQAVPAGAGNLACDGAEGAVTPRFELKTVAEYFHDDLAVIQTTGEQRARGWQSIVSLGLRAIDSPRRTGWNLRR